MDLKRVRVIIVGDEQNTVETNTDALISEECVSARAIQDLKYFLEWLH